MGYQKEIYEQAWQILDQRRSSAQATLQLHQEEVFRKIPEVAEIQRRMVNTAAGVTKLVLQQPQNASALVERLGRENLQLQHQREELLQQAGFPQDYLALRYSCPQCADTGYVGTQMCSCFAELLRQQAFARLSEVSEGNRFRFENFQVDYYPTQPTEKGIVPRQRMQEIWEFCKAYAEHFSPGAQSLLLIGPTGLGKTHLSLAIASAVIGQGFGVVYVPVQSLMDRLEQDKFSYDGDSKEQYSQNMASVVQCDLLVLDDLGTEFSTSFTKSVLYHIVNSRMIEGRPTIINTNLEPAELESMYSQRMASRLACGYKILRFYGEDVRFLQRQQRFVRSE